MQLFTIAGDEKTKFGVNLKPAKIETRRDLVSFIEKYVPGNFFYEKDVLARFEGISQTEKEYSAPLLQRNMEIIGKVVLTTTHVKRQECDGPE